MRVIHALLLPILSMPVTSCAGPAQAEAAPAIEVWSFNLRYGTANDGADAWPLRVGFVQELLAEANPDLLGVQEALPFQLDALAEALPEYDYWGRSRTPDEFGEQCGVLYRRARFRLVDGGHFWLSPTPEVVASRGWDAALPRMASWVVLEDLSDGTELLVAGTHFDHRGVEARLESARLLARRLPELAAGRPILLLGDFNADHASGPWQALAGPRAPFRDSYLERAPAPPDPLGEGTFHGFRGTPDGRRIDWVLVSAGWEVLDAAILRPRREGRCPSDHEPVRARVVRAAADGS